MSDKSEYDKIVDALPDFEKTDNNSNNDILNHFNKRREKPTPKLRPVSENCLLKLLEKYPEKKNELAPGLALLIGRKVLDLQEQLAIEYSGAGSANEAYLRQVLRHLGINSHPQIDYGSFIPNNIRLFWQEMGIDPSSEDDVTNFFRSHQITHLKNPGPLTLEEQNKFKAIMDDAAQSATHSNLLKPKPPGTPT